MCTRNTRTNYQPEINFTVILKWFSIVIETGRFCTFVNFRAWPRVLFAFTRKFLAERGITVAAYAFQNRTWSWFTFGTISTVVNRNVFASSLQPKWELLIICYKVIWIWTIQKYNIAIYILWEKIRWEKRHVLYWKVAKQNKKSNYKWI